jgi:hypothetical protein
MGHLLWWPINGLRIEFDAIQISLTFLPVQHSDKLLWRIGILTQRSICFYWKITRPRWQRQVVLDTTPRIEEGSIWMQESNVGKLWLAAKWATELPRHSSRVQWTVDTQRTKSPTPTTSPFLLLWCWIAMKLSRFQWKFLFFQISLLWSSSPMGFLSHWEF